MENNYFFREDEINIDSVQEQKSTTEMTWVIGTLDEPAHVEVMPEQYY